MDKQYIDSKEQQSESENPIVKENLGTEKEENQAPKMLIYPIAEMEMSAEKEVKSNGDSDEKDTKNEKSDLNEKETKCDNVIISTNDEEENPGNNVEDSNESQASKNITDADSKSQGTVNKLNEAEIKTKSEDKVLNQIKTSIRESCDSNSDLNETKTQFEKITECNEPDRSTPELSVLNTNQKEETNVKGEIVSHSKICDGSVGENKEVNINEEQQLDKKNVDSENIKDIVENATCFVSFSKSETDSCALKKCDELNMSSSQSSIVESVAKEQYDAAKDQETDDESNSLEHDESTSLMNEDSEGEFEDVEVPEEVDELIVPDDEGKDLTNHSADNDIDRTETACNENEITKDNVLEADEDETTNSKNPEDEESNEEHLVVPELVAIRESEKDSQISEDDDQTTNDAEATNTVANDPLRCLETSHHSTDENDQSGSGKPEEDTNSDAYQEDDDDVEFIETRNSPICIESDEEDDSRETTTSVNTQTICLPTHKIIIPKNLTVTRTSAKKSTARPYSASTSPQTVSTTGVKVKRFAYLDKATTYRRSLPAALSIIPQKVVATIEVLDSSDEDTQATKHMHSSQNLRTPPKRTLMAAKGANNNKMINKTFLASKPDMPNHFPTHIKQQTRRPAPPPLPPPTPQSNFLNNVHLQPATTSGSNPPAFSALLSNKSVIIPNAFYGNHPNVRGNPADAEMERRYVRWLETFIAQFCNPQLVASHSCFVFLQRALKYKDYVRIKQIRKSLNVVAQKATDHLNHQLMLDLRAIFLKSAKEITPSGRRFSEMACSTPQNKTVTLLIHASTGRIIMKSCNMEMPIAATSSSSSSNSAITPSTSTRKRQLDEDEYVPVKNKNKLLKETSASEHFEDDEEGRKRSLRSKRSRRIDNSFSYNEDDLAEYDLDDEEDPEVAAQAEIQRKIEEKRLEAQKQRQQQAKSFENEFIQAFAKNLDGKELNQSKPSGAPNNISGARARRVTNSVSSTSVQQHLVDNDAEDLLQATWIENVENEDTEIISDDEEPKEHRIYKQMQLQKQYQQQMQQMQLQRATPKFISKTTTRGGDNNVSPQQMHVNRHWPKNTDVHLHASSKNKDICAICNQNVQRIVHHYVNEHRGCEVYTSRLTTSQVEHLRRGAANIFNVSLYKNGQPQYEAHCIFCQKQSKFMLPYWIQHFTMHTGEYAYRCSGCGIRKPTRSLLTQHYSQCCPQNGSVLQDYTHDTKKVRVDARICTLCNFVQLHRSNIVKHLHLQHGVKQILPKHIQTIVLLKLETTTESNISTTWMPHLAAKLAKQRPKQTFASSSSSNNNNTYVIDDDDVNDNDERANDDDTLLFGDTIKSIQEQQQQQQSVENTQKYSYNYIPPYMLNAHANNNMPWEDNDPAEDLSYMICGMLDVQMNNE